MKTEEAIKRAQQKVSSALADEHDHCVALTKAKHEPNEETFSTADAALKSFKTARRAVQAIYKRYGMTPPKMPTIYMVEKYLNDLDKLNNQ